MIPGSGCSIPRFSPFMKQIHPRVFPIAGILSASARNEAQERYFFCREQYIEWNVIEGVVASHAVGHPDARQRYDSRDSRSRTRAPVAEQFDEVSSVVRITP